MEKQLRYYFRPVSHCNMCGSDGSAHRVLGKRLNRSQGRRPSRKTGIAVTIVRCTRCGLHFSSPQPVPFDLQDHYGVPPESYWKESYFEISEKHFAGELQVLNRLMAFQPGMKALDVGAGLGKTMTALARAGFDTYGFEPSVQFYERATSVTGIHRDKLTLGAIEEVDYPEGTFDFVTFGAVLEHLYDPSAALVKALRWLRPGGIIHVEVPSSKWLVGKIINLVYRLGRTDYVGNLSPMHEPYHLFEFGLRSFTEHAKRNAYTVAHHEYYVCETYLPRFADFILKPIMKWTHTGMQLCVWLRKT